MRPYLEKVNNQRKYPRYRKLNLCNFKDLKKIYTYLELIGVKNLDNEFVGNPFNFKGSHDYIERRGWWVIRPDLVDSVQEAIDILWPEN